MNYRNLLHVTDPLLGVYCYFSIFSFSNTEFDRLFYVAHPDILKSMILLHPEYTVPSNARIAIGTWNVNGGKHFRSIAHKHEDITDWLLDLPKLTMDTRPGTSRNLCRKY